MKEYPIVPDDYEGPDDPGPLRESEAVDTAVETDPLREVAGPVVRACAAGKRTIELIMPPIVDGKALRRVSVRIPEQGDIDDFASGEIATGRDLLSRLTGLHPAVIRALKWPDSEALHQAYKDVLPSFIVEELEG